LISSAGFILLFSTILYVVFKFLIIKKLNLGKSTLALKFKGKRATGVIQQVQQTGTYINEQPEIRFTVVFTDAWGREQVVQIKKIVSLLEVGSIRQQQHCILFYHPQDLKLAMFEEEVNH